MPASVCRNERIRLFWPPATGLVGVGPVVSFKDRIDRRPGGLNRVLTGEERAVAGFKRGISTLDFLVTVSIVTIFP